MTLREQLLALKREPLVGLGKRLNFMYGSGKATFGTDTERKTNEQLVDFLLARYDASRFVEAEIAVRDEVPAESWDVPKTPIEPFVESRTDAERVLIQALKDLVSSPKGVDEDAVRRIVADEVAKTSRVLEVRRPDVAPVRLDEADEVDEKIIRLVVEAGQNIMMVGPAGCGKTTRAARLAKALSAERYHSVSVSGGMTESVLTGRLLPIKAGGTFAFLPAPFLTCYRDGGVFLADEVDAADPNVLLVLNAALANGHIEVEGLAANGEDTRIARHPAFVMVCAANTYGTGADAKYVGRGALDGAFLDRFYVVSVTYSERYERSLFANHTNVAARSIGEWVLSVRAKAEPAGLSRIVSTRMIQKGVAAVCAGVPIAEVKSDLLAGWSADDKRAVGA
jgi:MoxR-like ATPase